MRFSLLGLLLILGSGGCNRRAGDVKAREARKQPSIAASASGKRVRTIYPYSLIPGGVESATELKAYKEVDPLLSVHYKGLGGPLELRALASDHRMYASYRVANEIYWTRKPLLIHAGEAVLADGASNGTPMVRARCGNRLSFVPQLPVRRFEPPVLTTDRHEVVIVEVMPPALELTPPELPLLPGFPAPARPVLPAVNIPRVPVEGGPEVTSVTPVPALPPPLIIPPKSPSAIYTPEPSTWMLMGTGLCGVFVAGVFRRRKGVKQSA